MHWEVREHSCPLLVGSFLQKRGERPRKVWRISSDMFTEGWGLWAQQAPFRLLGLNVWEVHRSPSKARNFKALPRYYKRFSWEIWGLSLPQWGGGGGSRPRCPPLLSCFRHWPPPRPFGPAGRLESSCMCMSVSTLTWQLRIPGFLGLRRPEESALTLHVLT